MNFNEDHRPGVLEHLKGGHRQNLNQCGAAFACTQISN